MPMTGKGKKVMDKMMATYGSKKKANEVFWASVNSGKLKGVEGKKRGKPHAK